MCTLLVHLIILVYIRDVRGVGKTNLASQYQSLLFIHKFIEGSAQYVTLRFAQFKLRRGGSVLF